MIPAYIDGKPVTKISKNVFHEDVFEVLVLPPTLESIMANAFVNCNKLVTMYFPDSVVSVTEG